MGHYCKICGRTRANAVFSGKGYKNRICKKYKSIGKEKLNEICSLNEIELFWGQSNISKRQPLSGSLEMTGISFFDMTTTRNKPLFVKVKLNKITIKSDKI